jgi:hypothetical protein
MHTYDQIFDPINATCQASVGHKKVERTMLGERVFDGGHPENYPISGISEK